MHINEYLALRSQISVTTGTAAAAPVAAEQPQSTDSFAQALRQKIQENGQGVEFSKHAMQRISERSIDLTEGDLERLNKGVEIAADKGSSETLVLVDTNAFVVSVKNNKVITTISKEELQGNIFTNIDSTVIM